MLRELFLIGIPAGLSNVLMNIAGILGNPIAAGYGDYVVAGTGVQMRIASLGFMLVFALTMGYQLKPARLCIGCLYSDCSFLDYRQH